MAKKKIENLSFEESLLELETIVQNLEQGALSLEDSMTLFERGLNLSQASQEKLKNAEQKIQILLTKNGKAQLEDFENEVDSESLGSN
ncbi:exodeoxyribonuclease VII small subunit [Colwellia sp. PAMC 20917]|uniref:exodeoxyribonuclease VII small subunit n=1 Tax=unclassified Colwellia TaxID=196834 RepID=UPI000878C532|nr:MULTISPECIES: exodeoxyribonuclease VII small subunit [unclassified Colwellia]MBA6363018.1 exodeoxyribonuclease VII small subunit [Colwellia sp. BRX8-8]AOW77816.1 exodeoxyribonuclease VII small subunit [Colwellia sp. PAMC 20917]MBA6252362.1 exodeoxyribonuclease VII small subunit [Colwellia sp. MB3u-55]MBA6350184.1 exodeoxyribonuclease VII small subunit [Colwellia sp. BRX8-9]MBA6351706.1 exodeoxyribonuclease VII small subunit [Colwellia sp. BRX9-1]